MELELSLEDDIETDEIIELYKSLGFERAGKTVPMWIYGGNEH